MALPIVRFNEEKAVQVTGQLLQLDRRKAINKLRLVKLLYLIDRQSFVERARPVIGGTYFSMPHGTVISELLDVLSLGDDGEWSVWGRYFQAKDKRTIVMKKLPPDDLLSPREKRIIQKVYDLFGAMTPSEIRRLTHELPEYVDPKGSSEPIPLERLLEAIGRTREDARRIAIECASIDFLSQIPS